MIKEISVSSHKRNEIIDITSEVNRIIAESGIESGICILFTPHTTAGITINENYDGTVKTDMIRKLNEVFPEIDGYDHLEGNSDAHIKSSLIGCSQEVIIDKSEALLGTWQGIFFCEFDGSRSRRVLVKLIGD